MTGIGKKREEETERRFKKGRDLCVPPFLELMDDCIVRNGKVRFRDQVPVDAESTGILF